MFGHSRIPLVPCLCSTLLLAACQTSSEPPGAPATAGTPGASYARIVAAAPGAEVVPGRYIVVLKPVTADAAGEARRLTGLHRGNLRFVYESALKGFAADLDQSELASLAADPAVERIEPDQVVHAFGVQSPAGQWGLDRIDQRALPLDNSYTFANGAGKVHIYIIDTGLLRTHTDFKNPNGTSRASFGFSAIHDGFDQSDCHGHGTHVSGIAAGKTFGVAKSAKLVAVRVLDCSGSGTTAQVIAGVNWVTSHKILPAVANMSLGGGNQPTLVQAITNSINAGVVYAIAAGNSNTDACQVSPANTPAALTIGASDQTDIRASFSNIGLCVDLFAPGVNILSDWNLSPTATIVLSGTSMATPHVAGAAALYLQAHLTATPAAVSTAIIGSSTQGALSNVGFASPNSLLYAPGLTGPPQNFPPVARFKVVCGSIPQGVCDFDASASVDDGGIVSYQWNFGDGKSGTGVTVRHIYQTVGNFNATLTVTDAQGQHSSQTQTLFAGGA